MIVAFAGHVDHGKTALIRALTGIDTDRLPEEKRRGMTIDLGFAYFPLSDGETIGFVDVPGHERFLPNMLAGVLGVDSLLLVVAADDGPMPQTLEHLSVVQLTGVADVTVVITKIDRVDAARVEGVENSVRQLLVSSGYPDAPILRVSSVTGAGVTELRESLIAKSGVWRQRPALGGFRMAIDRHFLLPGIGLVVTGTVSAGSVAVGESLVLTPPRLVARVRNIHVKDQAAEMARAGDRCALAITGPRIDKARVQRGHWLVVSSLHAPTSTIDIRVRVVTGKSLKHGRKIHLHVGTASVSSRLLLLDGGTMADGTEGFLRLALDRPIAALHGDRVVLRDEVSGRIFSGGHVIDPFPPERHRPRAERLARLKALAAPEPRVALERLLAAEGSVDLNSFQRARNLSPATLEDLAAGISGQIIGGAGHRVAVAASVGAALRAQVLQALREWHAAHPDFLGPTQAALLGRMARDHAPGIVEAALHELLATGEILREGIAHRLPEHIPALPASDEKLWETVKTLLDEAGLRPPRVRELAAVLDLSPDAAEAFLARLERFGRLVRVAKNRFFRPDTLERMAVVAADLAAEADGFSAADFNRRTGIGRNLTIEVLEYFDRSGITQRQGEFRHVTRPPPA